MAIYHCTTKTVNRSSGRTAVASMAYRAGEKLEDKRTGLTHDFTRKDGVAHTEIVSNLNIEIDRSQLWNLAEQSENRKDARTAREWVIALPDELDADQRKDLAKAFATALVDRYGVIADLAIHEPSKGGNDKNHHAHIMLTTRKAELDADNKLTLTTKTDIELSNAKRKSLGMGTTQDEIKQIRETWANLANRALERAGIQEKIDHRSYADQNNGLQATIHEGTKVTQLRRQGID
ncbi:MobQ family relaxase, partial [Acinetobacter towneri]